MRTLAVVALLLLLPLRQEAQPSNQAEPKQDSVSLKASRVVLAEIPVASCCEGSRLLADGSTAEIGGLKLAASGKEVTATGVFKARRALGKRASFRPSTFVVPEGKEAPEPSEQTLKLGSVGAGHDLEVCGADKTSIGIVRVERTWTGIEYGVVTGWEYRLEKEFLTVVDFDLDGAPGPGDRMIYGERLICTPWHTVLISGRTAYFDTVFGEGALLTAKTRKVEDAGTDAGVVDAWNETRKDHGVAPGIFSKKLQADCVKHAEYCRLNQFNGHEEEPGKPGYSEEGKRAGMSSCISFSGQATAMRHFLDSLYHRPQIIDPSLVRLQLGGNAYAFLMGTGPDETLPGETRAMEIPQVHPAPYSTVPVGVYRHEWPDHAAYRLSRNLGLPVIMRVTEYDPKFSDVDCRLFTVKGDARTGVRGAEVKCHLSHAGKDAPAEFPQMWSMVALTPLAPLPSGQYEASFTLSCGGNKIERSWRFAVGK